MKLKKCKNCKKEIPMEKPMIAFQKTKGFYCIDCFLDAFNKVYGNSEPIQEDYYCKGCFIEDCCKYANKTESICKNPRANLSYEEL